MRSASSRVSLPEGGPAVRFSLAEKAKLALEILAIYARVRWLLARRRLPEVVAALRDGEPRQGNAEAELAAGWGWRYTAAVLRTLRALPADSRCLVRSLVLLSILARRGARATLVIGVRSEPDFGAHAWVEHRGMPLLDPGRTAVGRLTEL